MLTRLDGLAMAGWCAAIFPLRGLRAAGCKFAPLCPRALRGDLTSLCRFAFVEYEDRRDADDAYHDMHNKRMGRDDILKIEVSFLAASQIGLELTPSAVVGSHSSFGLVAVRPHRP